MSDGRKRSFALGYCKRNPLRTLGFTLIGLGLSTFIVLLSLGSFISAQPLASISGYVFEDDGFTPTGVSIEVAVLTGDPCGGWTQVTSVSIDPLSGFYEIVDLEAGTYYLKTNNMNQYNYVNEWWADPDSTYDCNGAEPVTVSAGGSVSDIDFQLDLGGIISGTVYESDGTTPVGVEIEVRVIQGDPCGNQQHVGWATTDSSNGTYTFMGLPAGVSFLQTNNMNQSNYVNEWWTGAVDPSDRDCSLAQSISVSSGDTVVGKDFALDLGGIISGTVYESDGTTPVGVEIEVRVIQGDPCGNQQHVGWATTDSSNGTYTFMGLPAGVSFLQTNNKNQSNYVNEWWTGAVDPSDRDCSLAQSISVSSGDTVVGKDFTLDLGGIISGTVYESDGTTPVGVEIEVRVIQGDPCGNQQHVGWATTDSSNGTYTFMGLPAGVSFLQTNNKNQSNYVNEWWTGAVDPSDRDCSLAQSISVSSGDTVVGKDFALDLGGIISGTVYESDGTTPVGVEIEVRVIQGDPCGNQQHVGWATTDSSNGTYTFMGLPAGVSFLQTNNKNQSNYVNEWWTGAVDPSDRDCSLAQSISVSSGDTVVGKDFALDLGGIISGTVYESDGTTQIAGLWMHVFTEACGGSWLGGAYTDENGEYSILGLPPGGVYVGTCAWCDGHNYMDEWWRDGDGTTDCNKAGGVLVTVGVITENIDFQLDTDSDGDGMGDNWESTYFGDLSHDGSADGDFDGLIDSQEYQSNTDPTDFDSDNDGVSDGDEVANGTDPNDPLSSVPPGTGVISGTVYESDGTTPVGVQIRVRVVQGDPCGNHQDVGSAYTNPANGAYAIAGLSAGVYYLQTDNMIQSNYVNEWWTGAVDPSDRDCSLAQSISVSSGDTVVGKDFALDLGGIISGTVYESDGTTPVGVEIEVRVIQGDPCGNQQHVGWATTDSSNGTYTFMGLPAGVSFLQTNNKNQSNYVNEWWADPDSDHHCAEAEPVTVSAAPVTGINFQLDTGVSISGTIYESTGTVEITDVPVGVSASFGDPCGFHQWIGWAQTDPGTGSGAYEIRGVPTGEQIFLITDNMNQSNYVNTLWASGGSTHNCWEAESFTVPTTSKNFQLELGGSILGTVLASGATPLEDVWVHLSLQPCGWMLWGVGSHTDENGDYTIRGVPAGNVYVQSCATCQGLNYIDEWWDDALDCNQADSVPVVAGQVTPIPVNFALEQTGSISGTVLDELTLQPVEDSSTGSIYLDMGWHKFVYRHHEGGEGQLARAAFKGPGPTEQWDLFSTAEFDELHVAPNFGATRGIMLTNKRYTCWNYSPRNHQQMVQCVDEEATEAPDWYGEGIVDAVDHEYNVHGNDDDYTSYYEAYFYVEPGSEGTWSFSTDSDDASEIVIDDQVVAHWYGGHGSAWSRWESKFQVNVLIPGTGQWIAGNPGNPDGSYWIGGLPSGSYIVQAVAPGYADEFYDEATSFDAATPVVVTAPDETSPIDFTLKKKWPGADIGYIQHRVYEDGRDFNRLMFYLQNKNADYPTEDILSSVELKDPNNNTVTFTDLRFIKDKVLNGTYNAGSGWRYASAFSYENWYRANFDPLTHPLSEGTYALTVTDNETVPNTFVDEYEFNGLHWLPIISGDSFNIYKDSGGNLVWECDVPPDIPPELDTSIMAHVDIYKTGTYSGYVWIGKTDLNTTPGKSRVVIPKATLQIIESEGNKFVFGTQVRTNDNNNRTYARFLALFSFADSDEDWRLNELDNCPDDPNGPPQAGIPGVGDQLNTDGDGFGDLCDADDDNDGLTDEKEITYGTNPLSADTDGDGYGDWDEVYVYSSDPVVPESDLDGDGLDNIVDPCPNDPNNDIDGDGVCGDVDPFPLDPTEWADSDGDGYGDNFDDNCPGLYNKSQSDLDSDGKGDECDEDADGDGYFSLNVENGDDCDDLNPLVNPGLGNCLVVSAKPPPRKTKEPPDADGDTWPDAEDNCPSVYQTNQLDTDQDGYGDVCDTCPTLHNSDQSIPVWFKDEDNDGYSHGTITPPLCDRPTGYKLESELLSPALDCNDIPPVGSSIHPGAAEVPGNSYDDDCDASTPDSVQAHTISIKSMVDSSGEAVSYEDWQPVAGESMIVEFSVYRQSGEEVTTIPNSAGEVIASQFAFSLAPGPAGENNPINSNNPTNYPGAYHNDPSEAGSLNPSADFTADFLFDVSKIKLVSLDYGGSIKVRARVAVTLGDGTMVDLQEDFTFPKDEDFDGLGDFWEYEYGNLDPGDDLDKDGMKVYAEYRGCLWGELVRVEPETTNGFYDTVAYVPAFPPQGVATHMRTSPRNQDLFVKFDGFDASYPFAIGEAFHMIGVDVHALGASVVAAQELSADFGIDVATVTLVNGTYNPIPHDPQYAQSPHIVKRSERDWTFMTVATSSYGGDGYYGASCNIYKTTVDRFFADRTYYDYTTFVGTNMRSQNQWTPYPAEQPTGNGVLDPLFSCEDRNDNGVVNGGEDKTGNDRLDGDCPVSNVPDDPPGTNPAYADPWAPTYAGPDIDGDGKVDEWDFRFQLSPFDVDNDLQVEIPVVGSVENIVDLYENTKAQALKMFVTHELGHNTGVTLHTDVSTCAMFRETNNLVRDDHFSEAAANLVRIHNR